MFCPSCGKEIPDNSRYCLACGKSPTEAINASKPEERRESKRKSNTFRNIRIVIITLLGIYAIVLVSSHANNGTLPGLSRREPLTAPSFTVRAGGMYFVRFDVVNSGRVTGRFEASGGRGNDIEAVIPALT
jgi:hypothetical protein